jgi:hypothetical protein
MDWGLPAYVMRVSGSQKTVWFFKPSLRSDPFQ